jgi:ubiquinol-cytochrome c reductase cytochrome b subunit
MYVLPFGQMSLWGLLKLAPHVYFLIFNYIPLEECQDILFHFMAWAECKGEGILTIPNLPSILLLPERGTLEMVISLISNINSTDQDTMQKDNLKNKEIKKIRANLRIGPHNKDILSILFGSLLGDAFAEFRLKGKGTRIAFYQEGSHVSYLIWLQKLISELGYCNINLPKITTRLGKKGVVRKIIRFKT